MQLRLARLCLNCEEVHDSLQCPVCASEMFTYLTRWVPTPEPPRPATAAPSPEAEAYRQLVSGRPQRPRGQRLLTQSALALTVLGVLGWWWQNEEPKKADRQET